MLGDETQNQSDLGGGTQESTYHLSFLVVVIYKYFCQIT